MIMAKIKMSMKLFEKTGCLHYKMSKVKKKSV